jgi:hypothetical protein
LTFPASIDGASKAAAAAPIPPDPGVRKQSKRDGALDACPRCRLPFAVSPAVSMSETQPPVMQILFADHDFPDIDLEREIFGAAGLELKVAQCKREAEVVDAARGCAAILLQSAPSGAAVVEA